ncbi:MAG: hypothetical protein IPO53_11770 [Chitinophagaceae bacterium]|nr:hypothetical protein [Chitinophagaceae bacterium]
MGTFLLPTAKVETIIANEFKNVIIGQVEKQITKNAAKGAAFEKVVVNDVVKSGEKNVVEQVTIKANNGVGKTKMDVVSRTESGAVKLREVKASETAPLRPNQKRYIRVLLKVAAQLLERESQAFLEEHRFPQQL